MSAPLASSPWRRWFADHPAAVQESYWQHSAAAARIALRLLALSGACFWHALVPGAFDDTASRGVARLADELARRRRSRLDGGNGI